MVEIYKGTDEVIEIFLKEEECGLPLDLSSYTNITVSFPLQSTGRLSVDQSDILAVSASKSYVFNTVTIIFTSDTVGAIGNTIALVFNGVDDIDTVTNDHNIANPTLTVSHDGVGTEVLPNGLTITLENGEDTFQKVQIVSPTLGHLKVILSETDTDQLRVGKELPIELNFHEGPVKSAKIIREAITVLDSIF